MASHGKVPAPRAPELGAFPLDHFRECSDKIKAYMLCLEKSNHLAPHCRKEAKDYLECRMEKGLMVDQPIRNFGIPSTEFVETRTKLKSAIDMARQMGVVESLNVGSRISEYRELDGYEKVLDEDSKT